MSSRQNGTSSDGGGGSGGARAPEGATEQTEGEGSFADMVSEALAAMGGVRYLEQLAHDHPTAFLTLAAKVLLQAEAGEDTGKPLPRALAWQPPT